MTAILGLLGGAVVRYMPNVFGFIGKLIEGHVDSAREERTIAQSIELEKLKQGQHVMDLENSEALAALSSSLEELKSNLIDRQGARDYANKLQAALVQILQVGANMGLPKWIISIGWIGATFVEVLSASVQPMIAVCGFGMWAVWKISMFYSAWISGATSVLDAIGHSWIVEDWLLIDSILGFFLAGRAQKYSSQLTTSLGTIK